MRLLHLADLHIGKRVYEYSMLKEQEEAFRQVIEMLRVHQVDVLLIAGDIYDKAIPTMEGMKVLDTFLTTVKKMHIPICIISGNHDSAERLSFGRHLLEDVGVYFSGTYEEELQQVTFSDEYGEVCITLLPFFKPQQIECNRDFLSVEKEETAENSNESKTGSDYTRAVRQVLNRVTLDQSKRNILVAHQFVGKDGEEPIRMDSEIKSVGGVDFVDYRVFDAFDYVALGHLHGAQYVGRETVRYAGSFVKYSFSEARQKKTATLVTLGEKKLNDGKQDNAELAIEIEQLPFTPLHEMREIKGTLAQLASKEVLKEVDREDYLHITLTEEEEIYDVFGKLRAVYPNLMVLDFENARTQAEGADCVTEESMLEKGMLELFREFFEKQTGSVLEPVQEQILQEIIERSGKK